MGNLCQSDSRPPEIGQSLMKVIDTPDPNFLWHKKKQKK